MVDTLVELRKCAKKSDTMTEGENKLILYMHIQTHVQLLVWHFFFLPMYIFCLSRERERERERDVILSEKMKKDGFYLPCFES